MLKYGDPGYIEEDKGPLLYGVTFSFLAAAILIVVLRYGSITPIVTTILTSF